MISVGMLVQFIVVLIVIGVVYLIGRLIIQAAGLPPMAMVILQVLCLLLLLVWVLSTFGLLHAGMWPTR